MRLKLIYRAADSGVTVRAKPVPFAESGVSMKCNDVRNIEVDKKYGVIVQCNQVSPPVFSSVFRVRSGNDSQLVARDRSVLHQATVRVVSCCTCHVPATQ